MAIFSCRAASSSEKPRRSRSRKGPWVRCSRARCKSNVRGERVFSLSGRRSPLPPRCWQRQTSGRRGDLEVGVVDLGRAQQLGGVDRGQQVVHLEGQLVGELGQVLEPAPGVEDLEQTGHTAHVGRRKRRVGGRSLAGEAIVHTRASVPAPRPSSTHRSRPQAPGSVTVPGLGGQGPDLPRIGPVDEDAMGQDHPLFDVVGDDQRRLGREVPLLPEAQ